MHNLKMLFCVVLLSPLIRAAWIEMARLVIDKTTANSRRSSGRRGLKYGEYRKDKQGNSVAAHSGGVDKE
jgi:hypothetical protein